MWPEDFGFSSVDGDVGVVEGSMKGGCDAVWIRYDGEVVTYGNCSGGKAFDDFFYDWLESDIEEGVSEDAALSGSFGR